MQQQGGGGAGQGGRPGPPSSTNIAKLAAPLYDELKFADGTLAVDQLEVMLSKLNLGHLDRKELDRIVTGVAGCSTQITQDQTMAVLGVIHGSMTLATSNSYLSAEQSTGAESALGPGGVSIASSRAPLRRLLTKNRSYLETGTLSYDDAVVAYLHKLEEHRKKCEAEGRYTEAQAAALRLQDLKTAQIERLRTDLVANQARETASVQQVFQDETRKFDEGWTARIAEYDTRFKGAVEELRQLQEQQLQRYAEELMKKRPVKPKPSRDYLEHKAKEQSLARRQEYMRAIEVAAAADELYASDFAAAQQAFDAEQRLKITKFHARQKQEMEALLQRAARGKDELELKRATETERRLYRYRNVVAELESLHKLEIVQLENFLDAQVQAGKATPLKDEGVFRRRQNLYASATF